MKNSVEKPEKLRKFCEAIVSCFNNNKNNFGHYLDLSSCF